jgi:hypothetical protein
LKCCGQSAKRCQRKSMAIVLSNKVTPDFK